MGRKKKQIKKVENNIENHQEKKINTNMELTYSGNVHIDFIKNGKRIRRLNSHNDGATPLFTFLLNCLASDFREVDRPKYVYVIFKNQNGDDAVVSGVQLIANPSVSSNTTGTPILSYKILVPASIFNSDNNQICGLAFYSSTNLNRVSQGNEVEDYSMIMYLNSDKTNINVDQDIDLLITWQVKIESAVQETTGR